LRWSIPGVKAALLGGLSVRQPAPDFACGLWRVLGSRRAQIIRSSIVVARHGAWPGRSQRTRSSSVLPMHVGGHEGTNA